MPLRAGTGESSPIIPGSVRPADIPGAMWIDPLGQEWPMTNLDIGWFTTVGVKGLGAIPRTHIVDARARGGATLRHTQKQPRLITWPVFVEGRTHAEFLDRWRAVMDAFTMTGSGLGPGRLVVSRPDGSARWIPAYYQEGFDGDPEMGVRFDVAALTLLCPSPEWRSMEPTTIVRQYATAGGSYFSPYPNVSSSLTLGATTVSNPATEKVWPTWTIKGPAAQITATNDRTGESWTIDVVAHRGSALATGETITLSTDPPAVTGPAGANPWIGAINWAAGPVLWGLDRGESQVMFTVTSAGAGTEIGAEFYALHQSA